MDNKRHHSGSQGRKRAIEKKEKDEILLSKIPTLNNYFNQVSKITPSSNENNKQETINKIPNSNNFSTSTQYLQCTTSTSETVINDYDETKIIPSPLINNTDKFKDPADWTNNNLFRNYIAKFG